MTSREIPSGLDGDKMHERGIRALEQRHREALANPVRQPSRRLYTGSTMLRRAWAAPSHLRPGRKDRT